MVTSPLLLVTLVLTVLRQSKYSFHSSKNLCFLDEEADRADGYAARELLIVCVAAD